MSFSCSTNDLMTDLCAEKRLEAPVVNASDMKIYVNPLKAIREHEEPHGERRT